MMRIQPTQRSVAVSANANRRCLLTAAPLLFLSPAKIAHADPSPSLAKFHDDVDQFSISIPTNWTNAEGLAEGPSRGDFSGSRSGERRTIVWYKDAAAVNNLNLSVVITNLPADYPVISSFGNPFEFGQKIVNSQDQRYLLRDRRSGVTSIDEVQVALLEDAKTFNGPQQYYVEYTLRRVGEEKKRLYQLATVHDNGRYNRLFTLTAACRDEEAETYGPLFNDMFKTFAIDI